MVVDFELKVKQICHVHIPFAQGFVRRFRPETSSGLNGSPGQVSKRLFPFRSTISFYTVRHSFPCVRKIEKMFVMAYFYNPFVYFFILN